MDEQFKKAQKPWAKLYSKVIIRVSKPLYKISPLQIITRREYLDLSPPIQRVRMFFNIDMRSYFVLIKPVFN